MALAGLSACGAPCHARAAVSAAPRGVLLFRGANCGSAVDRGIAPKPSVYVVLPLAGMAVTPEPRKQPRKVPDAGLGAGVARGAWEDGCWSRRTQSRRVWTAALGSIPSTARVRLAMVRGLCSRRFLGPV